MSRLALAAVLALCLPASADQPKTVAERTNYQETSRHADVLAFCDDLAKQFPTVKRTDFGKSGQDRPLPLLILSDPPVATVEAAAKSDKTKVLVFANIHAGEVDGKEAVLALARDLATAKSDLLKKLVLLIVPNLNPDGNEKISPKNRTSQNGPPAVGERANAGGFDLNRDFVKLETPEIRALVRLVDKTDPLLIIDCHTTNGSYHRYTLTYDGPRHPGSGDKLVSLGQDTFLPEMARKVKAATGFDTFPYGNFTRDRSQWESYPCQPRYGIQYLALRGRVALLSESYTYASFADRVKASYAFVKAGLEVAVEKADELKKVSADARKLKTPLVLRTKSVVEKKATVLGYEEAVKDGRRTKTDKTKDYPVELVTKVEPTQTVALPAAYYVPPTAPAAIETLRRHGIKVDELREDIVLDVELATVKELKREERAFQKHRVVTLESEWKPGEAKLHAGGALVKTDQPLGRLAAYLLEPDSDDGLAAWEFFNEFTAVGSAYPVYRLKDAPAVFTGAPRPLPEDRPAPKPVTADTQIGGGFGGGRRGGFGGATDWVDADHFLQTRDGKLLKVDARTGRSEPFVDPAKLKKSLAALKEVSPTTADQIARQPFFRMDKAKTGTLFDLGGDTGFAYFDGRPAVRFTKSPGGKEFLTLAPTGDRVAYVRGGNLYAAAGGKDVQLTTDGGGQILNGKADWVYEEEIFNRNGRAFWWSTDGKQLAFMRFDDTPVKPFHLTQMFPARGVLETIPYPKAGDPNPTVKIGVASADGGPVQFLSLTGYKPEDTVVSRVGWLPGTNTPFAYVQNRTQTWLDVVTWPDPASAPRVLFRETTKAWVEDLGEPHRLKDGSLLFLSERSGYKHVYHYTADGKLIRPLTTGDWEVKSVARVDEDAGTLYVVGSKDTPTGTHLYRASLDGGAFARVTPAGGTHAVTLAPTGPLYLDRYADETTPARTAVFDLTTGKQVRMTDSNPMYERENFKWGKYERRQIPMSDGFLLEAAITYPHDFDPAKVYPVWLRTYAGPHAPTIRDGWSPRVGEQSLANLGVIVFQVDPRSASGKGAVSAWACYKQMGVSELKDLEEAVKWLCQNPWADAKRVGIQGHSYGGFMTAYALTHSKVFSAGISGAPPTDWKLYDSIYTERYMLTPQENKDGYAKTSVVAAAGNLHGKLLLLHGLVDDNVHFQNTAQLVDALQRANKDFEVMFYPRARHGIGGAHYQKLQLDFIKRALGLAR
ncbi:MAG: DPP IV N-terminal domain-containing protein [Gemmataceae bacterium]